MDFTLDIFFRTNEVLNIGIKIFPIAENISAKYEVNTESFECKYLINYNGAWNDLYRTN